MFQLFFYVRHKNVIRTILSFLLTREKTQQQTLQGKGPPKVHNHGAKSNFLTQTFKRTISKVQKMINVNDQSPIELYVFYYLYANPKLNTTGVTINYSYYL